MKGIVFTEFLELVGRNYGVEMMDFIIEASDLPSGGAYTAVGSYDHGEMITLVQNLSTATRVPVPELLRAYGQHLFARFSVRYPRFFDGITSCFEFLDRIEGHIHVEVRKLYPDAELPSIDIDWRTEDRIELFYSSTRPFAAFAEGLMRGAIAHFGEAIEVRQLDAAADGTFIRFELTRS
ncbi:heme NO-binding domain-containing protein [Dongia sp.]|uniref:heme NO-binding domain-containing protein n=1 Tax=Dongia sp. TaxID=1977262 RepID=UPI0037523B93